MAAGTGVINSIRNGNVANLHASYLFAEIAKRKQQQLDENPNAHLINLGIGDTTEAVPPGVAAAMKKQAEALGGREGYTGYESSLGRQPLREAIADVLYKGQVKADDVFVSDGSKCDIARLHWLFDKKATVAVQDPSYPAYVDSSVIAGRSRGYDTARQQYEGITYLRCAPENGFFPDFKAAPRTDIIYFCSPNNPTGVVATREQLELLVTVARERQSIIIYDTAYMGFIRDDSLPKTIYEISGAEEVAIETGSFSKFIGFTGVRLGWTVVPKELRFADGMSVRDDWMRILSTCYNGASSISQMGGLAALQPEGVAAITQLTDYYLTNTKRLRQCVEGKGYRCYGGVHCPYLWIEFPGKNSWEVFDSLLKEAHIVATPGVGFGPAGEGFMRLSAFGHHKDIEMAVERLDTFL